MEKLTREMKRKSGKAYRIVEKYDRKYPGCRGYVFVDNDRECVVLDSDRKQKYHFSSEGDEICVYDSGNRIIGKIKKKTKLFRSNGVVVTKGNKQFAEIKKNNTISIAGMKIRHSLLGFNYEIYRDEEIVLIRRNENAAQAIVLMEGMDEIEGVLLAAAMKILHAPNVEKCAEYDAK